MNETTDPTLDQSARAQAVFAHLGHFVGLPLLAPILILMLGEPFAKRQAREALNAHISVLLLGVVCVVGTVVTLGLGVLVAAPVFAVYALVEAIASIQAALRAWEGADYAYPAIARIFN